MASSGELICFVCVSQQAPGAGAGGNGAGGAGAGAGRAGAGGNGARGPVADKTPLPQEIAAARKVLGVKKNASWNDIQLAYRKKVKVAHPDQGGDASEFRRVQMAYELLKKVHEDAQEKA